MTDTALPCLNKAIALEHYDTTTIPSRHITLLPFIIHSTPHHSCAHAHARTHTPHHTTPHYAAPHRTGMGLQLGVDLFCVAPSLFSGEASRVLCMAYRLLRLPLYAKIAGMHLQKGGQGGQGGGKEKDSHRRSSRGILRANNAL